MSRLAEPWNDAEWRVILFYADVARHPRPLAYHGKRGLSARAASAYAAKFLRNRAIMLARAKGVRS